MYTQAVTLNPHHSVAFNNMGHILFETGNFEGARENFLTAVKIKHPNFALNIGAENASISTLSNNNNNNNNNSESSGNSLTMSIPTFTDDVTMTSAKRHKKYRMLTIDGGGIRGTHFSSRSPLPLSSPPFPFSSSLSALSLPLLSLFVLF